VEKGSCGAALPHIAPVSVLVLKAFKTINMVLLFIILSQSQVAPYALTMISKFDDRCVGTWVPIILIILPSNRGFSLCLNTPIVVAEGPRK
jgi:hypothetical protein